MNDTDMLLGLTPRPPLTGVARTRLRRARPLVTLAQLTLPVLAVTQATLDFPPARGRNWLTVTGPVLVLLICLWRWRRGRFRPDAWPRAALWMNGVAGVFLVAGWDYRRDGTSAGLFLAPGVLLAGVGGGWLLARLARRSVLEPFTIELADSPLELSFPSRDDAGKVLRIRYDEISVNSSTSALLYEVGPVERFVDETGPAVRFAVLGDTWTFPTDQGAEIAEVIQRRRPVPAAPQPPRRIPSHRELSTVDGRELMRRRREADARIAQAVHALTDARATERPAARAALREMCDQAIGELIQGADLLIARGGLMMRRDAARIQRIRDHYCGPAGNP